MRCLLMTVTVLVSGVAYAQEGPQFLPTVPVKPEVREGVEGIFPDNESLRSGTCRSVRFRGGVTPLVRGKITVLGRNTDTKEVYCFLAHPNGSTAHIWPVPDTLFNDLHLGPNGEACSYYVMMAVGDDGRKAIIGVYEGRIIHSRPQQPEPANPQPEPERSERITIPQKQFPVLPKSNPVELRPEIEPVEEEIEERNGEKRFLPYQPRHDAPQPGDKFA